MKAGGQWSVVSGQWSSDRRSAFTLIELLIVIAIIAILITILWAAVKGALADAKKKMAKAEMQEIVNAVTAYLQEYEKLPIPEADQAMADLITGYSTNAATPIYQALTGSNPRGRVFLSREITASEPYLRDPWNTSYVLYFDRDYNQVTAFRKSNSQPSLGNVTNSAKVIVRSYGPNRQPDNISFSTTDDILVTK
jgi:prepilin-type N-terminal cleavage/methylation domain-containing protein